MKVSFSKTQPYVPIWNSNRDLPEDQQIKCILGVLDMAALMNLLDAFTQAGLAGKVDTDRIDGSRIRPVLNQFGDLLPKYVTEFNGLFNSSGEAVTVGDLTTYPKFLNLALELLMKLSEISSPSEEDAKNSNKPSD